MNQEKIKKLKCPECKYEYIPRNDNIIRNCPKCQHRYIEKWIVDIIADRIQGVKRRYKEVKEDIEPRQTETTHDK